MSVQGLPSTCILGWGGEHCWCIQQCGVRWIKRHACGPMKASRCKILLVACVLSLLTDCQQQNRGCDSMSVLESAPVPSSSCTVEVVLSLLLLTCHSEMYQDLAGELTALAAQAGTARRLLQRANERHPTQSLPSALWEAGASHTITNTTFRVHA